jgi:hypothetical protein
MLSLWTIYDHPTDYPDNFVAREFLLDKPTDNVLIANSLEQLREAFRRAGLCCITRHPSDDAKIVETWL